MISLFVRRAWLAAGLLCAAPRVLTAQAATGTVRGKVTEASSGRGLADAQIQVVGTRVGTTSQASGEYVLTAVPVGARVVQIRRIGFQPINRTVQVIAGGSVTVDAALSVSAINLAEVVVTGTASPTEKRRVGTSIATVDSTVVSKAQAVTVDQALQGKIAGAQISQNSGGPGGGGISVRLRGTNSFIAGSDPLYIIDGVIVDNGSAQLADLGGRSNPQNRLADINPTDIDRIEIIRGAAAAALYGSRANNGVVQIFTKRGLIGKPRVTFSTRAGVERTARTAAVQLLSVRRERESDRALQPAGRHLPAVANLRAEPHRRRRQRSDALLRQRQQHRRPGHHPLHRVPSSGRTPEPAAAAVADTDREREHELHQHAQPVPGIRRAERLRHHGVAVLRADADRLPARERHLPAAASTRHEPAAGDCSYPQSAGDQPVHRLRQADVDASAEAAGRLYRRPRQRSVRAAPVHSAQRGTWHGATVDGSVAVGVSEYPRAQPGSRGRLLVESRLGVRVEVDGRAELHAADDQHHAGGRERPRPGW